MFFRRRWGTGRRHAHDAWSNFGVRRDPEPGGDSRYGRGSDGGAVGGPDPEHARAGRHPEAHVDLGRFRDNARHV